MMDMKRYITLASKIVIFITWIDLCILHVSDLRAGHKSNWETLFDWVG